MWDANSNTSRRGFLKTSAGLAAGASLVGSLAIPRTVHAGVDETLRIGLIGAGLRGTAAAQNALSASKDNVLTSVGDAFEDVAHDSLRKLLRSERVKDQVQVPDDGVFSGFDAYQKVIDSGVDVVILTQPPHFRPRSLAYAIEKNKHCFVEKPVAVDALGIRSVIESCNRAQEKGLSVVSGLCWRYHPAVQETVQRVVEDKAIGEIVSIQSCYNTGQLWHRGDRPEWSRMEYQVRNWIYFSWLGGDLICEQAVHSIDKSAWLLGDSHPIQAFALGGRQQRTEPRFGDVYDHFTAFYEFPDGVRVNLSCRQQDGCSNLVDDLVLGTKGHAWILENRIVGENPWHYEGPNVDMYDREHVELFRSIRAGQPINNGHYMANSNMMGIMGRMCAYTGQTLTWDQCLNSQEQSGPNEYAWNDQVPACEIAIPGKTKFA
jgi:predicted dehydrogenase